MGFGQGVDINPNIHQELNISLDSQLIVGKNLIDLVIIVIDLLLVVFVLVG